MKTFDRIRLLVGLLLVILLLVAVGAVDLFTSGLDRPTKLAAVGDLLAGGAFILALFAAIVATLAYSVAILKPDLRAEVRFGHGFEGLKLYLDPAEGPTGSRTLAPFIQDQMHIHLHNDGPVSARNPALKVRFIGMMIPPEKQDGWSFGDHFHGLGGFGWAQWDGGADFSIHPKWGRDLPMLSLYGWT